jgi:hypothetical protein
LYRFDVISAFVIAENGGKTIAAARGRARPEVKSPFSSSTRFGMRRSWNFSIIFYLSEVIRLLRFARKTPFEIFAEGIFPVQKFCIAESPKEPFLGSIRVV